MFDQLTRVVWIPVAFCAVLIGAIGFSLVVSSTAGRSGLEQPAPGSAVDDAQLMFEAQLDSARQRLLQAIHAAEAIGDRSLGGAVVAADEAAGRAGEAGTGAFDVVRGAVASGANAPQTHSAVDARLAAAAAELDSTFVAAKGAVATAGAGAADAALDEISDTVLDAEAEATAALADARAAIETILLPAGPTRP